MLHYRTPARLINHYPTPLNPFNPPPFIPTSQIPLTSPLPTSYNAGTCSQFPRRQIICLPAGGGLSSASAEQTQRDVHVLRTVRVISSCDPFKRGCPPIQPIDCDPAWKPPLAGLASGEERLAGLRDSVICGSSLEKFSCARDTPTFSRRIFAAGSVIVILSAAHSCAPISNFIIERGRRAKNTAVSLGSTYLICFILICTPAGRSSR